MLETKCVDDKFVMLVTDLIYIEKISNITQKLTNIMILPPTSEISHHHKVTNITMSPTSLSPSLLDRTNKSWFGIGHELDMHS